MAPDPTEIPWGNETKPSLHLALTLSTTKPGPPRSAQGRARWPRIT